MKKELNNQIHLSESTNNNDIHYFQNMDSLRKKIRRLTSVLICISSFLFFECYGYEVIRTVRSLCLKVGINLSLCNDKIGNIIAVLLALAGFSVLVVIYLLVHEMIHLVAYGNKMKYCKVIFEKGTAWVLGNTSVTKFHGLFITMAPFVFWEVLAGAVGIIANSTFVFLFITVVNSLSSSIDIFTFFYVLFMTPPGCILVGDGYRHQ